MEQYWSAMQDQICRKCIDGDRLGNCRLPLDQSCAVQEFLPQIVQAVKSIRSDRYDDYIEVLRKDVCANCSEQTPEGICRRRDSVECALDRYYGLVIQVIENVKTREASLQP